MVHGTLVSVQPGSAILVDGFGSKSADVKHYILSHFHSDHTGGLGRGFKHGTIYTTPLTADLIIHVTGVRPEYVCPVPYGEVKWIGGGPGAGLHGLHHGRGQHGHAGGGEEGEREVFLVFLDANHCPGAAVMLIGSIRTGKTVLHCGDFRGTPAVARDVKQWLTRKLIEDTTWTSFHPNNGTLDVIYLDNTYCRPRWVFPTQTAVLRQLQVYVDKELNENADKKILFFIGSYAIGKEKVAAVVAETVAKWRRRNASGKILALADGGTSGVAVVSRNESRDRKSENLQGRSCSPSLIVKTKRRWQIQKLVQKHYSEFDYFCGLCEIEDATAAQAVGTGRNDLKENGPRSVRTDQHEDDKKNLYLYANGHAQSNEELVPQKEVQEHAVWMVPLGEIRHDRLLRNLTIGPRRLNRLELAERYGKEGFLPDQQTKGKGKKKNGANGKNGAGGDKNNSRAVDHDDVEMSSKKDKYNSVDAEQVEADNSAADEEDAKAMQIISGMNNGSSFDSRKAKNGDGITLIQLEDDDDDEIIESEKEDDEDEEVQEDDDDVVEDEDDGAQDQRQEQRHDDKAPESQGPLQPMTDEEIAALTERRRFYEGDNRPSKRKQQTILRQTAKKMKIASLNTPRRRDASAADGGNQGSVKTPVLPQHPDDQDLEFDPITGLPLSPPVESDRFDLLIGFRPTGWAFRAQSTEVAPWISNNGKTKVIHMPYSEHSSFAELVGFVKALRPREVIPTVPEGGNGRIPDIQKYFLDCTDGSLDERRIEFYMRKLAQTATSNHQGSSGSTSTTTTEKKDVTKDAIMLLSPPAPARSPSTRQRPARRRILDEVERDAEATWEDFSPGLLKGYQRNAGNNKAKIKIGAPLSVADEDKDKRRKPNNSSNSADQNQENSDDDVQEIAAIPAALLANAAEEESELAELRSNPFAGIMREHNSGMRGSRGRSGAPKKKTRNTSATHATSARVTSGDHGGLLTTTLSTTSSSSASQQEQSFYQGPRLPPAATTNKTAVKPLKAPLNLQQTSLFSFMPRGQSQTQSSSPPTTLTAMKETKSNYKNSEDYVLAGGTASATSSSSSSSGDKNCHGKPAPAQQPNRTVKQVFEDGSVLYKEYDSRGRATFVVDNAQRKIWDPEAISESLFPEAAKEVDKEENDEEDVELEQERNKRGKQPSTIAAQPKAKITATSTQKVVVPEVIELTSSDSEGGDIQGSGKKS
ncbi:unnamed protein product [Amoebophrya sp. A25]|nr:unnamed protein product [Amoebophrya sp. A25]|eukprot:GSA25T00014754001.1